uniref:G-protein coupled receptors family 2 profile 2 domain-containing protein n=1 Tax=Esox lucius TaxID=8010 RepID=A0A6Q2XMT6_ESOLU
MKLLKQTFDSIFQSKATLQFTHFSYFMFYISYILGRQRDLCVLERIRRKQWLRQGHLLIRNKSCFQYFYCFYGSKHSRGQPHSVCLSSGKWSSEGCETSLNHGTFVCRCNHLSFFAVDVYKTHFTITQLSVDRVNAANLSYISYVGSALSVAFTAATLVMYMCFRKRHSEHSTGIHVQLTGALLFLHISYLLSEWWVWYKAGSSEGRVCLAFGMILHWALLSTFTWSAIEGFHLHVLLVRIFNIYVRKYLLKLSLVGWGKMTSYIHHLYIKGSDNGSSTDISLGMVVSYVTVSGYLGLVFLFNTAMLGVVMVKLWRQRGKGALYQERRSRMWKDWATVLGLSCVLGIPWGLAFCTYGPLSLIGLYLFSIFNSFQGVFMFLWFLALSRKGSAQHQGLV